MKAITINDAVEEYFEMSYHLKESSLKSYRILWQAIKDDALMNRSMRSLRPIDLKKWLVQKKKEGKTFSTLNCYYSGIIKPALKYAVEDGWIKSSPATFKTSEVIKPDKKKGRWLTEEEQMIFREFLNRDIPLCKISKNAFLVCMGLGLRISELGGLTVDDVDFERNEVSISRQIIYESPGYRIDTPKSESGVRTIPMTHEVRDILEEEIKNHKLTIEIDGVSGFIFTVRKNQPLNKDTAGYRYRRIVKMIDEEYGTKLTQTTVHSLRHTFCSSLINAGVSLKVAQYLMGHKNVSTTLDIYSHITNDSVRQEMKKLEKSLI